MTKSFSVKGLENGIYEVKDGQLRMVTKPQYGFGKQIITWQDGKVAYKEISFSEK